MTDVVSPAQAASASVVPAAKHNQIVSELKADIASLEAEVKKLYTAYHVWAAIVLSFAAGVVVRSIV